MESLSVLQRASAESLQLDPFPHVVIPNALPESLYNELVEALPPLSTLGIDETRNNARWDVAAKEVATSAAVPKIWKDFIAYHASEAFFQDIVRVLFAGIHRLYPRRYPDKDAMLRMRAGVRGIDRFGEKDVLMDALISGNTPVQKPNSVRTTHADAGRKLVSGLFYMRRDGDDSIGGDLTISRFKPEYASLAAKMRAYKGTLVDDSCVDVVKTVKYARNQVVLFINSLDSLHGVTVRQATPHGRYFMNLVAEVNPKLYRLSKIFHGPAVYARDTRPADAPPVSIVQHVIDRVRAL